MATYSAFFSSGLLAPRNDYALPKTPGKEGSYPTAYGDSSPIRPVSPLPPHSDSDTDTDDDMDADYDSRRESTPTQRSVSCSLAASAHSGSAKPTGGAAAGAGGAAAQTRTLRKRRSSLTLGTSPITSIRSPSRNVGAALQFQRHLSMAPGNRSRSGSMTNDGAGYPSFGSIGLGNAVASEGTSLMGRLRSGSMGSAPPPPLTVVPGRLRRHVRRTTSVPAPAPPPSLPLPDLPPVPLSAGMVSRMPFSFQNSEVPGSVYTASAKGIFKGRDRGLSVCSVGRIDEEMKEN